MTGNNFSKAEEIGIVTGILKNGVCIDLPNDPTIFVKGDFKELNLKIGQRVIVKTYTDSNKQVFLRLEPIELRLQEQPIQRNYYSQKNNGEQREQRVINKVGNYIKENKNNLLDAADFMLDIGSPKALAKRAIKKLKD